MEPPCLQILGNALREFLAVLFRQHRAGIFSVDETFFFMQVECEPGRLENTRTASVSHNKPRHSNHHAPLSRDLSACTASVLTARLRPRRKPRPPTAASMIIHGPNGDHSR